MSDITITLSSQYDISNEQNTLYTVTTVQYPYIQSQYTVQQVTKLENVNITEYPQILMGYYVTQNLLTNTLSFSSQYDITNNTNTISSITTTTQTDYIQDIQSEYNITGSNVDVTKDISSLYAILHSLYNIQSQYTFIHDIYNNISSIYSIYKDHYVLSTYNIILNNTINIDITYNITKYTSNIIQSIYDITNDKQLYINSIYDIINDYSNIIQSQYTINTSYALNTNSVYDILNEYKKYIENEYRIQKSIQKDIDIDYAINNDYINTIQQIYDLINNKYIYSNYNIKFDKTLDILSAYSIFHGRFFGKYTILQDITNNVSSIYTINNIITKQIYSDYSLQNIHNIISKYNLLTNITNNIISTYALKHELNVFTEYRIHDGKTKYLQSIYQLLNKNYIQSQYTFIIDKIFTIQSIYDIIHQSNIISKYIIKFNKLNSIISIYNIHATNLKAIISYSIQVDKTYNIINTYQIQHGNQIINKYNIYNVKQTSFDIRYVVSNGIISHINVSKDKYMYNVNNTGLILKIDYNTELINSIMNLDYISTNNSITDKKTLNNTSYQYNTEFNNTNINLQFIVDRYGHKQYIYQVTEDTDLNSVSSNKFIIKRNTDGTYSFKTNAKFSSNKEYYPYHIYLLSPILIQYPISESLNKKSIKKLYLIQERPQFNCSIIVTCNNSYIKLQKNYNINEQYYSPASNQLIFTPEEQQLYYDENSNKIIIPIKVVIYKNYIQENQLLVPISVDVDNFVG